MLSNNDFKAVCSVTELAKNLDMSRARFYQLQKVGVFPEPVYCIRTKRPFYPMDLQQKCLEIRRTGIGCNGRPIIFYSKRSGVPNKPQDNHGQEYKELAGTLKQMGLNVTTGKVKDAVKVLRPEMSEHPSIDGTIIRDLFRYFRQGV
jgi:hypothetical protein